MWHDLRRIGSDRDWHASCLRQGGISQHLYGGINHNNLTGDSLDPQIVEDVVPSQTAAHVVQWSCLQCPMQLLLHCAAARERCIECRVNVRQGL